MKLDNKYNIHWKIVVIFLLFLSLITIVSAQLGIKWNNSGEGEHIECGCSSDGIDNKVSVNIACDYYGSNGEKVSSKISIPKYSNTILNEGVDQDERAYLCGCRTLNINISVNPLSSLSKIFEGEIFPDKNPGAGNEILKGKVIEEMAYIDSEPCIYCEEWDEELGYLESYFRLKSKGFDVSEYRDTIIQRYLLSIDDDVIKERISKLKELLKKCIPDDALGRGSNGNEVGFRNERTIITPEFSPLTLFLVVFVCVLFIFSVRKQMFK